MVKIPKWFFEIVPIKIILSIFSVSSFLLLIFYGATPLQIGYLASILTLGTLFGSIYSEKVFESKNKVSNIISSYFLIFIILSILLIYPSIYSIYLSAFFVTFLSVPIYFSGLGLIKDEIKKGKKRFVSKFEEIGGASWILGLIIGFLFLRFLKINQIPIFLSVFSLISLILISILLMPKFLEKWIKNFFKEIGIIFEKERKKYLKRSYLSSRFIISSPIFPSFHNFVKIIYPKRFLLLHLAIFLIFITFGMTFSHLINLMKLKNFEDWKIFGISIIISTLHLFSYHISIKLKGYWKGIKIGAILVFLSYVSLFLFYEKINFILYLAIFYLLNSTSFGLILVNTSSFFLRFEEEIAINNFFKSLGYIIGSIIAGQIIFYFSYQLSFFISFLVSLIFLILIFKPKFP